MTKKSVKKYYTGYVCKEWNRLVRNSYQKLEFDTTLYFLKKYLPKKGLILDAGGGPGRYTLELAKQGYNVILLDITPANLELAKRQIKKAKLQNKIKEVVEGSIVDLSKFSDNTLLTANNINYQFSGVKIEKPDKYTIVFKLKEPYSPFLVTVSRPIFKKGFVGVGEYKVKKINLNGDFVESIDLISISSPKKIVYQFYPTYSSLKTAFVMSDVTKALDLPDILYKNKSFSQFKNSNVAKNVNTKQLVTLFYNTKDKVFSSKTLREVFHYTIPDKFSEGERSYGPYPRFSFVFQEGISNYTQDLEHAKLLKDKFLTESPKTKLSFTLYALPKYQETAKNLAGIWEKIGIKVTIKTSDNVPNNFQMFLGEFFPSSDPDQYVLWHTDQSNNITGYSNLRIDKILEDGRQTSDISARKKIYSDFQKYIALDPPASFLFFPYSYDVERK